MSDKRMNDLTPLRICNNELLHISALVTEEEFPALKSHVESSLDIINKMYCRKSLSPDDKAEVFTTFLVVLQTRDAPSEAIRRACISLRKIIPIMMNESGLLSFVNSVLVCLTKDQPTKEIINTERILLVRDCLVLERTEKFIIKGLEWLKRCMSIVYDNTYDLFASDMLAIIYDAFSTSVSVLFGKTVEENLIATSCIVVEFLLIELSSRRSEMKCKPLVLSVLRDLFISYQDIFFDNPTLFATLKFHIIPP